MAKNTLSNAFRKIDVDQFNEDNFKDDEVTNETSFGRVSESEIANLLNKGNSAEALKVLLASAPIGSKNQADKVIENPKFSCFKDEIPLKFNFGMIFRTRLFP